MARARIRSFRQSSLQERMGVNSIEEQERAERRQRVREFIQPKRFRGRRVARASRRQARRVSSPSGVNIFRRIAPSRKSRRMNANGTQSAADWVFG